MARAGVPAPAEQRIVLPAEPASAAKARSFIRRFVRGSRHGALEDAALLCVSELVSNVSAHTGSDRCVITVVDEPDDILIRVSDDSVGMPRMMASAPDVESGRGLQIVDALAGEWGVQSAPGPGKSIWLRLCET